MKNLIVKSNDLVNASFVLSLLEQKIMLTAISQLDSKSPIDHKKIYTIKASDLNEILSGGNYTNLKNASKRLIRRIITVKVPETENEMEFHWVDHTTYLHDMGAVEIKFSEKIVPYLSDLRSRFTQYRLKYVQKFQSAHSIRIYEMLISWQSTEYCYIEIDELRERLQLTDKYKKIADFQKFVIKKSLDEINEHSDIKVKYKPKKSGKFIVGFQFLFSYKKKEEAEKIESALPKQLDKSYVEKNAKPGESWDQAYARLSKQLKNN
jgi:plasmid replication initiation protein